VTDGVDEAELVLSCKPFLASRSAFVTSRAAESEGFRLIRDYFRDYGGASTSRIDGDCCTIR
jgi:hypothetical protein